MPNEGVYRTESLFMNPESGVMPNWFFFVKMANCHYCDVLAPVMDHLARNFHAITDRFNYIVAYIDCSLETSLFMCEYL